MNKPKPQQKTVKPLGSKALSPNESNEEVWLNAVKAHLNAQSDSLPEHVSERLYASRQHALRRLDDTRPSGLSWAGWLAPALTAGVLFALVVPWLHGAWKTPGDSLTTPHALGRLPELPELAELPDTAQQDVLENMEFYLWMDQHADNLTNLNPKEHG